MFALPAAELGLAGLFLFVSMWVGIALIASRTFLIALRWTFHYVERRRTFLAKQELRHALLDFETAERVAPISPLRVTKVAARPAGFAKGGIVERPVVVAP